MLLTLAQIAVGFSFIMMATAHFIMKDSMVAYTKAITGLGDTLAKLGVLVSGLALGAGAILVGVFGSGWGAMLLAATVTVITGFMHRPWRAEDPDTEMAQLFVRLALAGALIGLGIALGFENVLTIDLN